MKFLKTSALFFLLLCLACAPLSCAASPGAGAEDPPVSSCEEDAQPSAPPGGQEGTDDDKEGEDAMTFLVTIGTHSAEATFAASEAAAALAARLEQGEVAFSADDYGGFEKVGALGFSLPRNDVSMTAQPGDILLYRGDQIVFFYGGNAWSYTPLGRLEGLTQEQLRALLCAGEGRVRVTLSAP